MLWFHCTRTVQKRDSSTSFPFFEAAGLVTYFADESRIASDSLEALAFSQIFARHTSPSQLVLRGVTEFLSWAAPGQRWTGCLYIRHRVQEPEALRELKSLVAKSTPCAKLPSCDTSPRSVFQLEPNSFRSRILKLTCNPLASQRFPASSSTW